MKKVILATLFAVFLLSSCKVSDMRKGTALHKVKKANSSDQSKGKDILLSYIKKNGFDKMSTVNTYQIKAHETWKGMMGKMGNPWPENKLSYDMKFVPDLNDFTMSVKLNSKKKKGDVWGLRKSQSNVYHTKVGKPTKSMKEGKMSFNLANYQWWLEFPYRLSQVQNVTYAGVEERDGQTYDLVLATWGDDLKPSRKYDQYMVWFNKNTGLIDLVTFTYRDVPMMMPAFMYGTAILNDYKTVNGINMPHSHKFQINGPSKEKKYAHHFIVDQLEFDTFDKSELFN